jgi:hypothetical protein
MMEIIIQKKRKVAARANDDTAEVPTHEGMPSLSARSLLQRANTATVVSNISVQSSDARVSHRP